MPNLKDEVSFKIKYKLKKNVISSMNSKEKKQDYNLLKYYNYGLFKHCLTFNYLHVSQKKIICVYTCRCHLFNLYLILKRRNRRRIRLTFQQ
jgi:hypothetical protein